MKPWIYVLLVFLLMGCQLDNEILLESQNHILIETESPGSESLNKKWINFCIENQLPIDYLNHPDFEKFKKIYYNLFDHFNYISDMDHYGVKDKWVLMPDNYLYGDCEDFAVTLRHRLLQAGFSPTKVRLIIGDTHDSGSHMMVYIEFLKGSQLVCDSMTIADLRYHRIKQWTAILDVSGNYWNTLTDTPFL